MKKMLTGGPNGSMIGLWLVMASATSAEIAALAGFDWVLIDAEHGPNTIQTTLEQVRAIEGSGVEIVVRPIGHDPAIIKQYLDIGVRNFLVPTVESGEQAATIVAATRYPPHGLRGVASSLTRASGYGREANYVTHADEHICVIAQVESELGVENVQDIAATRGIDGIFVGPADLAASMGYAADPKHAVVRETVTSVLDAVHHAGKATGVYALGRPDAEHWISRGTSLVAVGSDIGLLANHARDLAGSFESIRAAHSSEMIHGSRA